MKISKFEDLEIWKESAELAIDIYRITSKNVFSKDFGLRDQIRRAIISVSSNIAEGFEIHNNNDFIRYLRIAKGSAGEARSQLYISFRLGYINEEEYQHINDHLLTVSHKIGKLMTYLIDKKNQKEYTTR